MIDKYIKECPKPVFLEGIDESGFREALEGCRESLAEAGAFEGRDEDECWATIYVAAVYFCKGMMWAEAKHGLREESLYPRY